MLHPDVVATLDIMLPGDPLSPEQQDAVNRGRALRPKFDEILGPNWRPQHPWLSQGSLVARDSDSMAGFMGEIPRWENPLTGQLEPLPGHRPDMPAPMPEVGDPNWGAKYDPGFFVDWKSNSVPMPQVGDPWWEEPADLPLQNRGQLPWEL